MPHLERLAVSLVVMIVGALLALSLYWTGEVAHTARDAAAFLRPEEIVALEARAPDLAGPIPEPLVFSSPEPSPKPPAPLAPPAPGEGPASRPQAPATRPASRDYEIRGGDRLETIALRELGSRRRVEEILRANEGLNPSRLVVGSKIRLPVQVVFARKPPKVAALPVEASSRGPRAAAKTHVVRKGETLWSIAARRLGDGHRWIEIVERNRAALGGGKPLKEGTTLSLP